MKKMLKCAVAALLTVALAMNVMPVELFGDLIAYAEEMQAVAEAIEKNSGDISDLPALAADLVAAGLEQTQDAWRFVVLEEKQYAIVTGYDGTAQNLEVPDLLGGADTVAIAAGALSHLSSLEKIVLPGNVLAIGEDAFPRGTVLAGVNASYAQKWARQNGYAFTNTSTMKFRSGVVDLTGIREENFNRVSASEVWLRELEAMRLSVGTRFFLLDPSNPYQISYYQVTAIAQKRSGFVVFECETPEVDDVLTYYEATDQAMMVDESSLALYGGVERSLSSAKSVSGDYSAGLDLKADLIKIKLSDDLSIKGNVAFSMTNSGSYKVGLFTTNTTTVKQETKLAGSVSLAYSHDFLDNEMETKDAVKYLNKLGKYCNNYKDTYMWGSAWDWRKLEAPLASGVVFSWAGIINITFTARVKIEFSGKASVTFDYTTVTTTTWQEGGAISKKTKSPSKSATGTLEAELKIGGEVSMEVYVLCCKVFTFGAFAGLDIKASYELEKKLATKEDDSQANGGGGESWSLRDGGEGTRAVGASSNADEMGELGLLAMVMDAYKAGDGGVYLDQNVNVNMLDCVTITFDLVVELEVEACVGPVTLASAKATALKVNVLTLHYHLLNYEVSREAYDPNDPDWSDKDYYYYTFGQDKEKFHIDWCCPYDVKTVKVVLPYDKDRISYYNDSVEPETDFDEPEAPNVEQLGHKLLGWCLDSSMDEELMVEKWPHPITQDTTFYACTEKMAAVKLFNADGSDFEGATDAYILEDPKDDAYVTLQDRYGFIARDEAICLPTERKDGTQVKCWIRVRGKNDLAPMDYSEENDDWQLASDSAYLIEDYWGEDDSVCFCAVTDKDVAVFFHSLVEMSQIVYASRGDTVSLPADIPSLPRYDFAGWVDSEGNAASDPITLAMDGPCELHYYAEWVPNDQVLAENISDIYVGTKDNGITCTAPTSGWIYVTNDDGDDCISITGYTGTQQYIIIPSLIPKNNETYYRVTRIDARAFYGNTTLRTVQLPSGLLSVGANAFSGCTNLQLIDMSATRVSVIPSGFAFYCTALQCVYLPVGGIELVAAQAFCGCPSLDRVRLNCDIGNSAFANCTGITQIELGAGVTAIGSDAFEGCASLEKLFVPDSVTSIGDGFIEGCTAMTELTLNPACVRLSAEQMFIGADSCLQTLSVGGLVVELGDKVFANGDYGFTQLTTVALPPMTRAYGSYILRGSAVEELTIGLPVSQVSGMQLSGSVLSGCDSLRTVTILSGTIPDSAFYGNKSLETVYIGPAVTRIGKRAFALCTGLKKVKFGLPDSQTSVVNSIGDSAFNGCSSLTELAIPSSVISFGAGMLEGCTGLKTLSIAGSGNTSLMAGKVSSSSPVANPFYIGEGAQLQTLILGDGVTSLGANVFANAIDQGSSTRLGYPTLQTIRFGKNLRSIGDYCFTNSGVTQVEFASEVDIRAHAFDGCQALTSVTLSGGACGASLFANCPNLTTVTITSGEIPAYAFDGCTALTSITLGEDVTSIGSYAFRGCTGLTALSIPDSVTEYGAGMIEGCSGLRSLRVGAGIGPGVGPWPNTGGTTNPLYIGENSQLETLELAEGITTIGHYALTNSSGYWRGFGYPNLTKLILPSTLTEVGSYAFSGMPVQQVTFKGNAVLQANAFYGITSLQSVTIPGGTIGNGAFAYCSNLKTVTLGENVISIGEGAFRDCTSLTSLSIPDSVTEYGGGMIQGCSALKSLRVGAGIGGGTGAVGPWPNTSGTTNPLYIGEDNQLETLELAEGITIIGHYALTNSSGYGRGFGYPNLTKLILPSTLGEVGSYAFSGTPVQQVTFRGDATIRANAFYGITSLQSVTIPGGTIGNGAFAYCANLKTVTLGENVTSIGRAAFVGCTSLTSLSIPDSVTEYGGGIIYGCTSLRNLRIGAGIGTCIGPWPSSGEGYTNPFYIGEDNQLETLELAEGITEIGRAALANDAYNGLGKAYSRLTTLILPTTLTYVNADAFCGTPVRQVVFKGNVTIADFAFRGNAGLETVTIPGGTIGKEAFTNCSNLKTVMLGEDVTSIGYRAFANCTSLTALSIPDSVTAYGGSMIEGCTSLRSLRVGAGIGTCVGPWTSEGGSNPLYIGEGSQLETLELAEGITAIGDSALSNSGKNSVGVGYSQLKTLILPSTLTEIGPNAMRGMSIRELVFKNPITIGKSAFGYNASLESVEIQSGTIGESAFISCGNLKTVKLGEGVTSIGASAFKKCSSLTALSIPDSVTAYGVGMIWGCTALRRLRVGAGIGTSFGPWPYGNSGAITNPFFIGEGSLLETVELPEGVTSIGWAALSNDTRNSKGAGYPELMTLIIPSTVTSIADHNLPGGGKMLTVRLPDGLESLTGTAYFNKSITLYTTTYNSVVDAFAQNKGLTYVYSEPAGFPKFRLCLIVRNTAVTARDLLVSDGTMIATRGTEGEEAVLAEGDAILSDTEVPFSTVIELEEPPVGEGCVFVGWYTDPQYTQPWTLSTMPPVDLTLYAKILEPVAVDYVTLDESGEATLFQHFARLEGSELPVPETDPEKEHAVFSGWYTDAQCLSPAAIRTVPAQGITLYAGFIPQTRVTFAVNLERAGTADETLPEGFYLYCETYQTPSETFALPADPKVDGYVFEGWFCDETLQMASVPNLVPLDETVIYGKLTRLPLGGVYKAVEGGVELVSYRLQDNEDSSLSLPSYINGQKLVSIGAYAFRDSGVTSVRLPDTVQRIDPHAFSRSNLYAIHVSKTSAVYASSAGVLYNKDMTELICYPEYRRNAHFDMPDTVIRVDDMAAVNNRFLTTIRFSTALKEIGQSAFSGCSALSRVELPDSVTTLRNGAFSGCTSLSYFSAYSLTTIESDGLETIPRNMNIQVFGPLGQGVLRDWFTFRLENGETYTASYNPYPLDLYVDGALLRNLYSEAGMPLSMLQMMNEDKNGNTVQTWYQDSEMTTPWNLDTDLMPAQTLSLYATLTKLFTYETVTLEQADGAVTGLSLTGYHGSAYTLTIPETLDGQRVIAISASFLQNASGLEELHIGSHILSIDASAMAGFDGVIFCDADSAAWAWAQQQGADYDVHEYTLAFEATGLTIEPIQAARNAVFVLPTPERGASVFLYWCTDAARTVPVERNEEGLYVMPGYDHTLYAAWAEADDTAPFEVAVANDAVTITGYTGSDKKVVIPQTLLGLPVTAIGDEAFRGTGMQYIDLGTVSTIGAYAFAECANLVNVALPDTVTHVGAYAFTDCTRLHKVELGAGIAALDPGVFSGCGNLSAVQVSENNGSLSAQDGVLLSRDGSQLLLYPAGKTETTYSIPEGVAVIGASAFAGQRALANLTVPDSVTTLRDSAFRGCIALASFEAASVTEIGSNAFFGCVNLKTVNAGERLSSVGEFAFAGCASLQSVHIPAGVTLDAQKAYFGYSALTLIGTTGSSAYEYALANGLFFDDPNAVSVQQITLNADEAIIGRARTYQLTAAITPEDAVIGTALRWVSSDKTVAMVDENGLVSALGVGTALIRAYSGNGCSATCKVMVDAPAEKITLSSDTLQLECGDTWQLTATLEPVDTTDVPLTWISSDERVVTVDENGLLQAAGAGEALITAETANGLIASCAVKVIIHATEIALTACSSDLYLTEGLDTLQITVETYPENATAPELVWESSDPAVVSVDENGRVTALTTGTATITATAADDSGMTDEYLLTVHEPLTVMTLPAALKQVGEEAFLDDSSMQYVILGDQVTAIGARAFAGTSGLVAIRIPSCVVSIADDAFADSDPLVICEVDSEAYRFAVANGLRVWCEK